MEIKRRRWRRLFYVQFWLTLRVTAPKAVNQLFIVMGVEFDFWLCYKCREDVLLGWKLSAEYHDKDADMSHNDLDAYTAKHELVACKKILVNKVLTNEYVKAAPALIEKIKQISLQLEECMAAINSELYSQSRSVNSSRMAMDQFNEHYWRLKPDGATHAIFNPQENLVYWGKSNKADAHHIKDIQYIWSLSHWSDHHQLLTLEHIETADLNVVKFPRIDKIAIRYDGQVYVQPMPSEYGVIYESLYKRGLEPTPFDAEQGFVHPMTLEFVDAKQASIYAKYIGMLPEDSEVAQLTPAMIA